MNTNTNMTDEMNTTTSFEQTDRATDEMLDRLRANAASDARILDKLIYQLEINRDMCYIARGKPADQQERLVNKIKIGFGVTLSTMWDHFMKT